MIVIHGMIAEYQNEGGENEKIFKLFEDAKRINFSEDEKSFQKALNWMDSPPTTIK